MKRLINGSMPATQLKKDYEMRDDILWRAADQRLVKEKEKKNQVLNKQIEENNKKYLTNKEESEKTTETTNQNAFGKDSNRKQYESPIKE